MSYNCQSEILVLPPHFCQVCSVWKSVTKSPRWLKTGLGQLNLLLGKKNCNKFDRVICVWTNGWVNNRDAGDMRCHHAHYDCNGEGLSVVWHQAIISTNADILSIRLSEVSFKKSRRHFWKCHLQRDSSTQLALKKTRLIVFFFIFICIVFTENFHVPFSLRFHCRFFLSLTDNNKSAMVNSSPPSVPYMCQWIRSAWVQIMACRLSGEI